MKKKCLRYERGFTLIELIMIIVITGIAIIPISNMILEGVRGTIDSNIAAIAPSLAMEKMEETKQLAFSSVSASSGTLSSPFTDYSYTVSVGYVDENFNTTGSSLYKKVDITIQYVSGYSLALTTVISDHN